MLKRILTIIIFSVFMPILAQANTIYVDTICSTSKNLTTNKIKAICSLNTIINSATCGGPIFMSQVTGEKPYLDAYKCNFSSPSLKPPKGEPTTLLCFDSKNPKARWQDPEDVGIYTCLNPKNNVSQ